MAYYSLEPWGAERADLMGGIVASTIANCHRDPKRTKAFSPTDFMPKYDREPTKEATPTDLKQHLLATFGGKITKKAPTSRSRSKVRPRLKLP